MAFPQHSSLKKKQGISPILAVQSCHISMLTLMRTLPRRLLLQLLERQAPAARMVVPFCQSPLLLLLPAWKGDKVGCKMDGYSCK